VTTDETGCPCEHADDPHAVRNLPGLSQLSYRVDDFAGFRRALLRARPGETALGSWAPVPGDLGLQVLEWWAYLADVLTFYNERIANESYLRTATLSGSIADLAALLGYEPAPGIAATGSLAMIRSTARPREPLVIPAGMQVQSTATPGVPGQVFEVSAGATFASPSDVPIGLPPDPSLPLSPGGAPISVLLSGRVSSVKVADALLLVARGWHGGNDQWSWVTVTSLAPEVDPATKVANTRVTFATGSAWGPSTPAAPKAEHATATTSNIFAKEPVFEKMSAAPTLPALERPGLAKPEIGLVTKGVAEQVASGPHWFLGSQPTQAQSPYLAADFRLLRSSSATTLWNHDTKDPINTLGGLAAHLTSAVRAISTGDLVLFDDGAQGVALTAVSAVSEQLWTVPFPAGSGGDPPSTIPIAHTVLALGTQDEHLITTLTTASTVLRYGFRDVGTVVGAPATSLTSLPVTVSVPTGFSLPPGGITGYCEDAAGDGIRVVATVADDEHVTLAAVSPDPSTLSAPLAVPLRLLLDVVPVSRGATVTGESLGAGNPAQASQSFTLKKGPLTYLAAGAGYASTLGVYVNGIEWTEVDTFYDQPATAEVYVVERAADQSTVRFGDGVNGARLPAGAVTATYRYGSGAASPPAGRLTTIVQRQANLATVHNPVAVSGGADPQSPDDVRANAPASVFAFGRAVSAADYQVIAAQAAGVSRVAAYWGFDATRQRTVITLYVGDDAAAVQAANTALLGADDPNRPISVLPAISHAVTLSATIVVSPDRVAADVVAAAFAALSDPVAGPFSPAQRGVGKRLYRSEVDAALIVPGVVAARDLVVRWRAGLAIRVLDEVLDPGESGYFVLDPQGIDLISETAHG
jgi:hypothetical protein